MNAYSIEERSAEDFELTESNIIFNVAWNVFREVMECGFFMIPFFVGKNAQAIPASAAIGIASASIFGTIIHVITEKWRGSRSWLAVFVAWLIGQLSAGLFQSGCHNFEFVYGSTPVVYKIENERLADNRLPMLLIGPFGYSSTRTVLQIVAFWSWCFLLCFGHYFKHRATIKKMNEKNTPISSTDDQDDLLEVGIEENLDSDSESLPVQDNIAQT
uniref:Uncharacterized protein n=1 Tax=Corethron hystrix TaxID=216773 RepID=A0A7S1FPK8_9STRA